MKLEVKAFRRNLHSIGPWIFIQCHRQKTTFFIILFFSGREKNPGGDLNSHCEWEKKNRGKAIVEYLGIIWWMMLFLDRKKRREESREGSSFIEDSHSFTLSPLLFWSNWIFGSRWAKAEDRRSHCCKDISHFFANRIFWHMTQPVFGA